MTPDEFRNQGHTPHLKAFLESPCGHALIKVLEYRARPIPGARQQLGDAEDVKLQMSLNYVKFEEGFALIDFIKALIKPTPIHSVRSVAPDLIPEDADEATLKARGIVIP